MSPLELAHGVVDDDWDDEHDESGLHVRRADLERAAPPKWAWEDRIVISYLNLLLGAEGVGKGTLVAWLIARLTNGQLPGDLQGSPIAVGVIGDEDSFDDVWTPRLHAAGADLERVVQIERPDGGYVNVREDRERLIYLVRRERIEVLFFDALLDNLGIGVDDWRQKAVRDALQPIRALARELGITTLGSLHPNKRGNTFRELMAGAPAFNAVSRSSLLLAPHPGDETRRVVVRGKGNLARTPAAIDFEIAEHVFNANGYEFKVPHARDFQVGDLTVDDLIGSESTIAEHSKVATACEIIEALLPRDGVWHPAKPIQDACADHEIDQRTAQRGKVRLKIEHRWTETFPAAVEWRWPGSDDTGTSSDLDVAPVVAVAPDEAEKPSLSSSDDTHDSDDSENKRRPYVVTGEQSPACCCADGGADPDEFGRCSRCFGWPAA